MRVVGRERLPFELLVEVAMVPEPRQWIRQREPHGLQLPVYRALVQRDRDDGADERGGQERRAVPEHGEHEAEGGHDREGDEGRGGGLGEELLQRLARRAGDDEGDEHEVDDVEGRCRDEGLQGEPAEALLVAEKACCGRGSRSQGVDTAVVGDPGKVAPAPDLYGDLSDEGDDDGRFPAVDDRCPDDEDRRERCASHGHVLERDGEGLGDRRHDEQGPDARKRLRARLRGRERGCCDRDREDLRCHDGQKQRQKPSGLATHLGSALTSRFLAPLSAPGAANPGMSLPTPGSFSVPDA